MFELSRMQNENEKWGLGFYGVYCGLIEIPYTMSIQHI